MFLCVLACARLWVQSTAGLTMWFSGRIQACWELSLLYTLGLNLGAKLQPQLQTRFPKTWHIFTLFLVPNSGGVFHLFSSCGPTRWLRGLKAPDVQEFALNLISKTHQRWVERAKVTEFFFSPSYMCLAPLIITVLLL